MFLGCLIIVRWLLPREVILLGRQKTEVSPQRRSHDRTIRRNRPAFKQQRDCDQRQKGNQVYRKRLRNQLDSVEQALEPYRTDISGVVVESTYNWYWLVDGLMDLGYTLHLRQYRGYSKVLRVKARR